MSRSNISVPSIYKEVHDALGYTEHFKMKQTALPFSIVEMVWPIGTTVPPVWPSIPLTGKTTAYYPYRVSRMFLLFIGMRNKGFCSESIGAI